jgi:phage I-like protein/cation transport regulator ChaB
MPYTQANMPDAVKKLPSKAQSIWVAAFNEAFKAKKSEQECNMIAWGAVKNAGFKQNAKGTWSMAEGPFNYAMRCSDNLTSGRAIEIMRTGQWDHPRYGTFQITQDDLQDFVKHFDERVRGIDISFDLEHGETVHAGASVGWVKKLSVENNSLMATVEWTELGTQKIKDGEYRYFSPEFTFSYKNAETGVVYTNVLLGGSLTNRPFIKEMQPVLLSEEVYKETLSFAEPINNKEDEVTMNKELLKALKLSETATQVEVDAAVEKQIADSIKLAEKVVEVEKNLTKATEDLAAKTTEVVALTEQVNTLTASKTTTEQENIKLAERVKSIESSLTETTWNSIAAKYLSEGKMTPAMAEKFKASYLKDAETTLALMETLQPAVDLSEKGTAKGKGEVTNLKLFEAKIAEIVKDRKVGYQEAVVLAEIENPELFKLFDAERRGL